MLAAWHDLKGRLGIFKSTKKEGEGWEGMGREGRRDCYSTAEAEVGRDVLCSMWLREKNGCISILRVLSLLYV